MKKILNQREIDAILGQARADGNDGGNAPQRPVELCNFRKTGQMSDHYARFMTSLFEVFARSVSNSLGAYLRAQFEMVLASVEMVPVRDFLGGFQESGFAAFLTLEPGGSVVVLQIDTALVFPIIDVLLGGFGKAAPTTHELTEIDKEIMEGVALILGRQLETTWQSMGVKIRLDHQQKATQVQSAYSATEKLTILTFEAKLNETTGAVILSFPASLANTLLREMSSDPRGKARTDSPALASLRARVLECQFDSTLGIPNLKLPVRELAGLRPGSVLNLRSPIKSPAALILGGREFFVAVPVRSGRQRAAQLIRATANSSVTQDGS